jgi:hypothetical protein
VYVYVFCSEIWNTCFNFEKVKDGSNELEISVTIFQSVLQPSSLTKNVASDQLLLNFCKCPSVF